jgi:hypothetical protein
VWSLWWRRGGSLHASHAAHPSDHTHAHTHTHPPSHTPTQLCLSLAAEAALTLQSGVVYLDSNGAFCARRLRAILLEKVRA